MRKVLDTPRVTETLDDFMFGVEESQALFIDCAKDSRREQKALKDKWDRDDTPYVWKGPSRDREPSKHQTDRYPDRYPLRDHRSSYRYPTRIDPSKRLTEGKSDEKGKEKEQHRRPWDDKTKGKDKIYLVHSDSASLRSSPPLDLNRTLKT